MTFPDGSRTDLSIKYVVACYAGRRRSDNYSWWSDPRRFVKAHLGVLRRFGESSGIQEAVFVVNGDGFRAQDFPPEVGSVPVSVQFRPNCGFSYAAWQSAIVEDLRSSASTDFYFLIEDDYVPMSADFLHDFVVKSRRGACYVAQLVLPTDADQIQQIHENLDPTVYVPSVHAGISNGLLSRKAAQQVYEQFGELFPKSNAESYLHAEYSQILFLSHFARLGFELEDVSDRQLAVYANAENVHVPYGPPTLPLKVAPYGRGSFAPTHALVRRLIPRLRRLTASSYP